MNPVSALDRIDAAGTRLAAPLAPAFLLALRWYVAWQFLKSGWLKLQDWDATLYLFTEEYHVPAVSPAVAAVLGAGGEIVFPVLLILGVATRFAAAGLSAVNVVAVIAYAHVLYAEGFEAALGQHWLWGVMLATVFVFGGGRLSVDAAVRRAPPAPVDSQAMRAA